MKRLTFAQLVRSICSVHAKLSAQAARAINTSLTLRNYLIGMYIVEFELYGADRSKYGENLVDELSAKLVRHKISACGRRQLYNYTAFYRAYPGIVRTLSAQSKKLLLSVIKLPTKVPTMSAQSATDPEKLLSSLSYSHFEMLVEIDDPFKDLRLL